MEFHHLGLKKIEKKEWHFLERESHIFWSKTKEAIAEKQNNPGTSYTDLTDEDSGALALFLEFRSHERLFYLEKGKTLEMKICSVAVCVCVYIYRVEFWWGEMGGQSSP